MAKIVRKTMQLFANAASNIGKFGSLAAGGAALSTDPAVIQALSNWGQGWSGAVVSGNSPAIEDVNAVDYVNSYGVNYLHQTGVAEWDSGTTYFTGSLVNDGLGNLYASLIDNNLNNALTVTTAWLAKNNPPEAVYNVTSTISVNDPFDIQCNTPSAAVVLTLPTTNVAKGKKYRIRVIGATVAHNVTLNSSNGSAIEIVYGTGYIEVIALIATPVAATDWDVIAVADKVQTSYSWSMTGGGGSSFEFFELQRINGLVTITFSSIILTAVSGSTLNMNGLPAKFCPTIYSPMAFPVVVSNNGGNAAGLLTISSSGNITIGLGYGPTTFTAGSAGLAQNTAISYTAY